LIVTQFQGAYSDNILRNLLLAMIGGETVPHIRIEDKLHELVGGTDQVFAITTLPDEKKGERIIVVYTLAAEVLAGFCVGLNYLSRRKYSHHRAAMCT